MSSVTKLIFPFMITVGAIYLIVREIIGYFRLRKSEGSTDGIKKRMFRRIIGAVLVISMAVMLSWGLIIMQRPTIENWRGVAGYWTIVIVLVFISIILAIWDMFDGVKKLEKIMDGNSRRYLEEIEHKLVNYKLQSKKQRK